LCRPAWVTGWAARCEVAETCRNIQLLRGCAVRLTGLPVRAQVCSPVLRAPAAAGAPGARFEGVHYIKCLSLAALVEYIMCDSLRP